MFREQFLVDPGFPIETGQLRFGNKLDEIFITNLIFRQQN